MSDGFKAGALRPLLPAIRKLCRYDRPRGRSTDAELPVSFGWLDHRGYRIAFRRVALPEEQNRRGNFAAHILAAPSDELPAAAIACSYDSPFWWSGLEEEGSSGDTSLPALALDSLAERPQVLSAGAEAQRLLSALIGLDDSQRLAVDGDGKLFGAALSQLGVLAPEALDGISLSTYEGKPTFPFRVIGAGSVIPESLRIHHVSLAAPEEAGDIDVETARELLSPEKGALLREAAAAVGGLAEPYLQRARRLVSLALGNRMPQRSDDVLFGEGRAVSYLCQEEAGRRVVAAAISSAPNGVEALRHVLTAIADPAQREALYAALADEFDADALARLPMLLAALPDEPGRTTLTDAALQVALGESGAADGLPPELAALLIERAAETDRRPEEVESLLGSCAQAVELCATKRTIPDSYMAVILSAALRERRPPRAIARAIALRPSAVASHQPDEEERRLYLSLLSRLDLTSFRQTLPTLLPAFLRSTDASAVSTLISRLPAREVAPILLSAAASFTEMSPGLGATLQRQAAAAVEQGELTMAVRLLEMSRSDEGRLAVTLLREAQTGTIAAVELVRQTNGLSDEVLISTVRAYGFRRIAERGRGPADMRELWNAIESAYPDAEGGELLSYLLELTIEFRYGPLSLALLTFLGQELLRQRPELLKRNGSLRDERSRILVGQMARTVPLFDLETAAQMSNDRRVSNWWDGLTKAHMGRAGGRAKMRRNPR